MLDYRPRVSENIGQLDKNGENRTSYFLVLPKPLIKLKA